MSSCSWRSGAAIGDRYVGSSVVLRVVLRQSDALPDWSTIQRGIASRLLEVECLRTIDRLQHRGVVTPADAVERRSAVFRVMDAMEIVELTPAVLHRASQPMVLPLGTLDALHLATADLWREVHGIEPVMLTHDRELVLAARWNAFRVLGI